MELPIISTKDEETKIIRFIQNTFKQANKSKAVIALSGGIDSSVSFALTQKALGSEAILPIHLPSKKSDPIHTKHVQDLLKQYNFPEDNLTTINVASIIQKSWRIINHYSNPTTHLPKSTPDRKDNNQEIIKLNQYRLANLMARIRMMLIFDHAKKHDALVIGTENYSEHLLGYYTRFGDEASDLEPIRHLYKTQLFELARFLEIPEEIITKKPSADLWVGQSDEKEMGFSYKDADPILYLLDQEKTKEEIASEGFNQILIESVLKQVKKNNFKLQVPYKI